MTTTDSAGEAGAAPTRPTAEAGGMGMSRSRNSWTLVTLAVLLVFALVSAFYALFGSGQAAFVSTIAFVASLVLGALMWMESRRNVGLVVLLGVLTTAFFVAYSTLVGPAEGSLTAELGFDLIYLLVPILAYLSYRRLATTA